MQETRIMEPIPGEEEIRITAAAWLDEVSIDESTLDFPVIEGDIAHRERLDTPRVRHLFSVPRPTTWRSPSSRMLTTTTAARSRRARRPGQLFALLANR